IASACEVRTFQIREATLNDVPLLADARYAMFQEAGYTELETMRIVSPAYIASALRDGTYRAWIAETETGERVGSGAVTVTAAPPHPLDSNTSRATVWSLYTDPAWRRRGIARQLMTEILSWCRAKGLRTISLHATPAGAALYEQFGFRKTSEMQVRIDVAAPFESEKDFSLSGEHIRLEPLGFHHVEGLVAASAEDPSLYQWSPVPRGADAVRRYIETALAWKHAGSAVPFAIVRGDRVVGSTRFWNIERWSWPAGRERVVDACEIGYTWLAASAVRTPVNTEAKRLMLGHAFENWGVLRVCFHTDARNVRSPAALERIGAKREGVLRAHRLAADFTPRDSIRYSIVAAEWPAVKGHLDALLHR
ncbi:MAG TPA: GNAT family N-acetyltransferase, partial [Thermoanaerobaculia bacterium]|nr:GNAT family N-acetyltransferase [Thermoanaerobaculia bacterium]